MKLLNNREMAQTLRSAASAFEHGRYATVRKKLQTVCKQLAIREEDQGIYIYMEGGVIHDIQNIPANVVITTYDYDIDGLEEKDIQKDGLGERCHINRYFGG